VAHNFASVCVNGVYVSLASQTLLKLQGPGGSVKVCVPDTVRNSCRITKIKEHPAARCSERVFIGIYHWLLRVLTWSIVDRSALS
jgi:hypothetical protein